MEKGCRCEVKMTRNGSYDGDLHGTAGNHYNSQSGEMEGMKETHDGSQFELFPAVWIVSLANVISKRGPMAFPGGAAPV